MMLVATAALLLGCGGASTEDKLQGFWGIVISVDCVNAVHFDGSKYLLATGCETGANAADVEVETDEYSADNDLLVTSPDISTCPGAVRNARPFSLANDRCEFLLALSRWSTSGFLGVALTLVQSAG